MEIHSGRFRRFASPEKAMPLSFDKSIVCDEVEIFVNASNKKDIYIGGPGTNAADDYESGWRLEPGDVWMVPVKNNNIILLSDIYVAAKNSSDRLSFGYITGRTRQSLLLSDPNLTP